MNKLIAYVLIGLGVVALYGLLAVIGSVVFMFAWNYVASAFWAAAPQLTWMQSFAVVVLLGYLKPTPTIKAK